MSRFTPWPKLNCSYGAPVGRADTRHDFSTAKRGGVMTAAHLACAGPAGEYDAGGAYWGLGGMSGGVYAVWEKGNGREGVAYVRARSRHSALAAVLGPNVATVRKAPKTHNGAYSLVHYRAEDCDGNTLWQHVAGENVARRYAEEHGAEFIES